MASAAAAVKSGIGNNALPTTTRNVIVFKDLSMSRWFVPPVVVPAFLLILIAGYGFFS